MKYLFIPIILLLLLSCNQGHVKNTLQKKYSSQYQLKYSHSVDYITDSITSTHSSYIQYVDGIGLVTHSQHDNSLRVFDGNSLHITNRIFYEYEGGDGVGEIQGFIYLNPDSIYVYSYWGGRLYLTNSHGKVLDKYLIYDFDTTGYALPAPYLQTSCPLSKIGNNMVMNCFIGGEGTSETDIHMPVSVCLDLSARKTAYINQYPEQYAKYNWGSGLMYRLVYYTANNREEMVLSFAADHNVYVYSFKDKSTRQHYAGSSSISGITSFDHPKGTGTPQEPAWEWYMQTPSYQGVFYDAYRNVYYRMARLPVKNYQKGIIGNPKPVVIIILDSEFNYIGESLLPDAEYFTDNCFVSPEGFHIQVESEIEDNMSFYVFEMTKI